MDSEKYNELAGFLEKGPTEEGPGLLREILSDDRVRSLFKASLVPEGSAPGSDAAPLRVTGFARFGFNDGILRAFEMEGVGLAGTAKRISGLVGNLSSGKLPVCIPKSLTLQVDCLTDIEELRLELGSEGLILEVSPSGNRPRNAYLEIWQGGRLTHAFPVESERGAASTPLRLDKASLLRVAGASLCLGLRVAPVQFTRMDWISAALGAALVGDFGKSIGLLEERLASVSNPLNPPIHQVAAYFKGLMGVTCCQDFWLLPAPATRSNVANQDRLKLALGVPWAGIEALWPEVKDLKSPWSPEGTMEIQGLPLPSTTGALLRDCLRAFDSGTVGAPSPEVAADRTLNQAWLSFQGWRALVEKRYEEARGLFASVETDPSEDPFGIALGGMLSSHLVSSERESGSGGGEENRIPSERIWRFITDNLVSAIEES